MLSLDESREVFDELNAPLFELLRERTPISIITSPMEAFYRLSANINRPKAVLITDAAITEPSNILLHAKLVEYAKTGGIVVYACQFSSFVAHNVMNSMFKTLWNLPWEACSYTRERLCLNTAVIGLDCRGLARIYSGKALRLSGVERHQSVYIPLSLDHQTELPPRKVTYDKYHKEQSAAAFAQIGRGYVGYVGDVNCEAGTNTMIVAMCLTEGPPMRTPTSEHNSVQVSFQLLLTLYVLTFAGHKSRPA